jgi:hypothetical protein
MTIDTAMPARSGSRYSTAAKRYWWTHARFAPMRKIAAQKISTSPVPGINGMPR